MHTNCGFPSRRPPVVSLNSIRVCMPVLPVRCMVCTDCVFLCLVCGSGREQQLSVWVPFQNAASAVTTLYKDCIESQKRFSEFGFQCGQQKRNKELLSWIKKRKRLIRREELIAFLSGATPQSQYGHPFHHHFHHSHHRSWNPPKPRLSMSDSTGRSAFTRLSLNDGLTDGNCNSNLNTDTSNNDETDLETFREALEGLLPSPAVVSVPIVRSLMSCLVCDV
jgi:hypothetical protein